MLTKAAIRWYTTKQLVLKITKEMVSKKTIKGDTKDDVVSISNDKFEINVYDNYTTI